jgi:hypothetical protein
VGVPRLTLHTISGVKNPAQHLQNTAESDPSNGLKPHPGTTANALCKL